MYRAGKGLRALEFLLDYAAIEHSSRRIILLNMTKLAIYSGDHKLAPKLLGEARKEKDPIIEKRIKADTVLYSFVKDTETT